MTTDIYTIQGRDSATAAVDGLVKVARFKGLGAVPAARIPQLANALLDVAHGLDLPSNIRLWMEIKPGDAVVHVKADCAVDLTEEERLMQLSTTGKNTERKGIFEKIKGVFEEFAIADNEELHTTGYMPTVDYGFEPYPVTWSYVPPPLPQGMDVDNWDAEAAGDVRCLADRVEVGYDSDEVEIAAHIRFASVLPS